MQVGRWLVAISIITTAWACGGDDSKTSKAAVTGTGGAEAIEPCGGALCKAYSGPGLTVPLQPCCADQFTKTCGVRLGASCRQPPAETAHPTCPSVDMSGFGFVLFGCCTENKCGLVNSFTGGNSCTDIETLQTNSMMMGRGGFIQLPPPMSCD